MTARYYGLGTLLRCLQAAVGITGSAPFSVAYRPRWVLRARHPSPLLTGRGGCEGLVSPSLLLTGRGGHSRATWSAAAATAEPGCVEDGGPQRRPCRVARHWFTFKSSSGRQPASTARGGRDGGSLRCERQSICAEAAGSRDHQQNADTGSPNLSNFVRMIMPRGDVR